MRTKEFLLSSEQFPTLWGVGPRIEEAGADRVKGYPYSAPYEDVKLKKQ